jgi:NAD(P)-dependent dehydrogenase (short-subunit alcohol dehydrogenase family)
MSEPRKPAMNKIDLSGRVAVVTGGASGLGLATARRFLDSGARVCLWDLRRAEVERAAQALDAGDRVMATAVDVSIFDAVESASDVVRQAFGAPDILFNCAGISIDSAPLAEIDVDTWQRVIQVNLNGTFYCCRALIPGMVEKGYGRIVNVSSIAGKEGNAFQSAYSASKAGVIALTKSLGKELATTGVVANCMAPSVFDTPMHRRTRDQDPGLMQRILERIPMNRVGDPDELAAMAAWLASEECSFTTGMVFDLSGGRATY